MKISSIKTNGVNPLNNSSNSSISKRNDEVVNPQFMDFLLELFAFGKTNPAFLNQTISENTNNLANLTEAFDLNSENTPIPLIEKSQDVQNYTNLEDYLKVIFPDTILSNYSEFELINKSKTSQSPLDNFVNLKSLLNELVSKDQTLQLSNLINLNSGFTSDIREKLNQYLPKEILQFFEKDLNNNNLNIQKELYQIALLFEKKAEMKIEKISNSNNPCNIETLENYLSKEPNSQIKNNSEKITILTPNETQPQNEQIPELKIQKEVNVENNQVNATKANPINQLINQDNVAKANPINQLVNQDNATKANQKISINSEANIEFPVVNLNKDNKEQFTKSQNETSNFLNNQGLQLPNLFKAEGTSKFSFYPNVKMEEVPQALNKMITLSNQNGTSKASISLQPNNLGMIFVNLEIKKDFVNLTLRVEKIETLEKLQETAQSLKEALVSQGFKNENISLKFEYNQTVEQKSALNDGRSFNQKQNNQNFTREYSKFLGKMYQYAKSIDKQNNTAGVVK